MWVFDATPLIYLAKVERLGLVSDLDGDCEIPRTVYSEVVVDGLADGYADARRVERYVEDGHFKVISAPDSPVAERLQRNPHLSDADIAVLARAAATDSTAVMDEAAGRTAASVENIDTRGTAFLVLRRVKEGKISAATARETIDSMIDAGWYCAPDLYADILGTLDDLS